MFIAGAYHPDTPISSAIFPMLWPKAVAMSLFHVLAIMTADGNPTEPVPVKLLLMEAGPSQSMVCTLPILDTAIV